MKGTRRYTIGAAIADVYVLSIVLGALPALVVAVTRRPMPLWEPFLVLGLVLGLAIGYHAALSRIMTFRSPGEILMGRVVADGRKEWSNPFGISRTTLFTVFFVALIVAGNSWDSTADGTRYATLTVPVVLGRAVMLFALVAGLLMAAQGRATGAVIVVAFHALAAVSALLKPPSGSAPGAAGRVVGMTSLGVALFTAVVMVVYMRAAARKAPRSAAGDGPSDVSS